MTIKLPEPDYKVMFNGGWRNLYYEESLKQAMRDVLEEGCELLEKQHPWITATAASALLRKLKEQL